MNIGTSLNLKDYRIIKVMLDSKNPEECTVEIDLSLEEIQARRLKIKNIFTQKMIICKHM